MTIDNMECKEKVGFEIDERLTKGMLGLLSHDEIDKLPKEWDDMKEQFHGWRSCGGHPEFLNHSRFKTTLKLMKIYASLYHSKKYKKVLFYINPINIWKAYRTDLKMRKEYKYNEDVVSRIDRSELNYGNLRLLSQTIVDNLVHSLGKYMKMKAVSFGNDLYVYIGKYERPNYTTVFRVSNRPCDPYYIDSYIKEADIPDDEKVRFISVVISYQEEKSKILGEYIFSSEEIQRNKLHNKLLDGCKELLLGELVEVCDRRPENEEVTE